MKPRNLIISLLLTVCGVFIANAQSLVLRHRDGKASVIRVTDSLNLQTSVGNMSVISGSDTLTYNNDDILSITYRYSKSDVNRDYLTNISDVVTIINRMAGKEEETSDDVTDVNGDGKTDISDVVAVINVMAGTDNTQLPVIPDCDADFDSETGDAFYIFRNDGNFNAFLRVDADSITFSKNKQMVHTLDSTYAIPLAAIDSVSFRKPEVKYKDNVFHITEAHLPYVISADEVLVVFSTALPDQMRPSVGQAMVSDTFEEPFGEGFMGTVVSIEETGQGLVISCSEAKVTDVFEELVLVGKVVAHANDNISEVAPRKKVTLRKIQESGSVDNIEIPGTFEFKVFDWLTVKDKITLSCDWYLYVHGFNLNARAVIHADHDMNLEFNLEKDFLGDIVEPFWIPSIPILNILGIFDLDLTFGWFTDFKAKLSLKGTVPIQLHQDVGFEVDWPADDMLDLFMGPIKPVADAKISLGDLKLSLSLDGAFSTGIAARLRAMIIGEKVLSGTITGRFGPEFGANITGSVSTSMAPEDINAYTILKDSKIYMKLKADAKGKFKVFGNQWPKENDDSETVPLSWKWEWPIPLWSERYFVPEFTKPELPPYNARENAMSMFTVPNRDIITKLFGYHVGIAIYDMNDSLIAANYNDDVYHFAVENKVNPSIDISQLTPGQTYRCVPMLTYGKKASPSTTFTMPEPVSLTKQTLKLNRGGTRMMRIHGGWGHYRVTMSNPNKVNASLMTHELNDTTINDVFVEAKALGEGVIYLTDIRSKQEFKLTVDVTDEELDQDAVNVSTSAIDFGLVPAGESKTMQFSVTSELGIPLTVTLQESHGEFDIAESGSAVTVEPGSTKTFDVVFSSTLSGREFTKTVVIDFGEGLKPVEIRLTAMTEGVNPDNIGCTDDNHPHVIDMGPAGKWACCNVGAKTPWETGGYYSWGETAEKTDYSLETYEHCDKNPDTFHDLGSDIAGTKFDVALNTWGDGWAMPDVEQFQLLLDNCTSVWTNMNGRKGQLFTSPNGASLFVPAAEFMWDTAGGGRNDGYYWSSVQDPDHAKNAFYFYLTDESEWMSCDKIYPRYYGLTVRPVYKGLHSLKLSTTSIDFGYVRAGASKTTTFTVTNSTEKDITFTMTKTGEQFSVYNSGEEITLTSGEYRIINVVFSSSESGQDYTGEIIITSKSDNDKQTIVLNATTKVFDPQDNGTDMTYLITNPAYLHKGDDGNADYAGWAWSPEIPEGKKRNYGEPMNLVTYSADVNFSFEQTIPEVPAGKYRLSVYGFYRAGTHQKEANRVASGEPTHNIAMFAEVGDAIYMQDIMNLYEGAADVDVTGKNNHCLVSGYENLFVPDGAVDCLEFYIAGYYNNILEITVDEAGPMRIGITHPEDRTYYSDYAPIGAWKLVLINNK